LSFDVDELRRMLKKKGEPGSLPESSVFDRLEAKEKPPKAVKRRIMKSPSGEILYEEVDETTVDPYTLQPEHTVTYATAKCEQCGLPITGEMLTQDQVKPCILCGKFTCPRCRVNTDVAEYLKPEVRHQPLCGNCFHAFTKSIILTCPNCDQPVKSYYDIKTCAGWCDRKVCPSCGAQGEAGQLLCRRCFPKYTILHEEMKV
jgi:hypothetical protein